MTDNNNTKDDRNKLSAVWNAEPNRIGLDDKITIIENWSYEALKYLPPWIMPEAIESDGYYFAAHSREDFKIVYTDILRLESVGVDIWYDRAMEPSKDWRELAKRMMNRQECKGVIVYGTVNSMASEPVQAELLLADELGKNIIFINRGKASGATAAKDLYEEAKKTPGVDCACVEGFEELLTRIGSADITYIDLAHNAARKKEQLDAIKPEEVLIYKCGLSADVTGVKYLGVKSVKIPENVTIDGEECEVRWIGACAFANCRALEKIELPETLREIGKHAFFGCESLTKVHLGRNVWYVAENAFENCENLKEVSVADRNKRIIVKDGVCYSHQFYGDGYDIFYVPHNLKGDITLLDGLKRIKPDAFAGRRWLTSVTIPNSVTSIGEWAFNRCTSLTSITIPVGVTSIGSSAFDDCNKLIEVHNKSSLGITAGSSDHGGVGYFAKHVYREEGGSWFSDTEDGFRFFYDGETGYLVAYLGDETKLTLPESFIAHDGTEVTSYQIYKRAFCGRDDLTAVTIPDSVTSIERDAFRGCTSLTSIAIPDSVTSIGEGAFSYCHDLKYNEYDNALYLGNEGNPYLVLITAKDDSIVSIAINGATKLIYIDAFYGCTSLTSITIPDSVTSTGYRAFYNCTSLTSITIPESVTSIEVYTFDGCTSLTSVTIPDSVTSIGSSAFYNCNSLTSITIPDSVTSIGNSAFYNCNSLTSITIPNSVTSIGDDAFYDCTSLTSITIPESVTSIGYSAFCGCTSLTSVTIGNSVESIGPGAFWGCTSLTSVTIPDSATSMGESAFSRCGALRHVAFLGTAEQWKELTKMSIGGWASGCPCETVKCKDGEVPVTEHDRVSIFDLEFDIEEPGGDEEE